MLTVSNSPGAWTHHSSCLCEITPVAALLACRRILITALLRFDSRLFNIISFYQKLLFQDYTDRPRLVEFSPRIRSSVDLRSTKRTTNPQNLEEDFCITETILPEVVVGKYFAVLGDCSQGYYIVKCLAGSSDKFSGQYLEQELEQDLEDSDTLKFKLTSEKDLFDAETILVELVSVKPVVASHRYKQLSITKKELGEVLLIVAQIDDVD